ncbi:MAG: hypothetical protein SF052_26770 [Bacteroidia bacterium]|nr:hypothetical protein [Bacteroidia bacterium]
MELTQIELLGIQILEPVTSLTDFITATVCFTSFTFLQRQNSTHISVNLMKYYFLLMGIGMIFAAFIGHAFLYMVTTDWKMIGWIFSAFAILMFELSSAEYAKPYIGVKKSRIIQLFGFLQISGFLLTMAFPETRNFTTVKINSTLGLMGVVLPVHGWLWLQQKTGGSNIFSLAVIYGVIPAIVYNTQFTLHRYFNYHDISHVLMSIFILILFRGTLLMRPETFSPVQTKN